MSTSVSTDPYYKQGLEYLANMGNFANVVQEKANKVGERKTYIITYITNLAKGIDEIKKKVEEKIKDVKDIDGKFDTLIKTAIGDQKKKLNDVYGNLKEISDFEDIIKELGDLKSSVDNIGNVVGQSPIDMSAINDPGASFITGELPALAPEPTDGTTQGGKRRKSGSKKGMKGGYTYGKLRKRSKKGKKGRKGKRRTTLKK